MTKQSFFLFVAPLGLLVFARGGYRNWRNVFLLCGVALLIAGPWYLEHLDGLTRVANEATTQGAGINPYGPEYTRFSLGNYAWYAWTAINTHLFLPLALLFAAGLGYLVVGWVRTRRPALAPELVVGSVGGYLAVALLWGFQDPRYPLPALVFVAAVGAGWIVRVRRPLAIAATVVLFGAVFANTLNVNTGDLGLVQIRFPGAGDPGREFVERRLVVVAEVGYSSAQPKRAGRTLDILKAAKRDGVGAFAYDTSPMTVEKLGAGGLFVFSREAGLPVVPGDDPLVRGGPQGMWLARRPVPAGGPQPCTRFEDGSGLYVFRGAPGPLDPTRQRNLYCPL